jgi:hypothetical protein
MTPLAFLHVFKTGGTATSDWIDSQTQDVSRFIPDDPTHFQAEGKRVDDFDLVRGHFELRSALQVFKRPRVIFTLVRRPHECLMSQLWHRAEAERGAIDLENRDHRQFRAGHTQALIRQAQAVREQKTGLQSWFFFLRPEMLPLIRVKRFRRDLEQSAVDGLRRISVVGVTHRLQDSLRILAWRMKWPAPPKAPIVRQSGAGGTKVPWQIRLILRQELEMDQTLFEVARARFNNDHAVLVRAASKHASIDDFLNAQAQEANVQSAELLQTEIDRCRSLLPTAASVPTRRLPSR